MFNIVGGLWRDDILEYAVHPSVFAIHNSEVYHPRCMFKLYAEVNSVKNTTINIWLNDGVY